MTQNWTLIKKYNFPWINLPLALIYILAYNPCVRSKILNSID